MLMMMRRPEILMMRRPAFLMMRRPENPDRSAPILLLIIQHQIVEATSLGISGYDVG